MEVEVIVYVVEYCIQPVIVCLQLVIKALEHVLFHLFELVGITSLSQSFHLVAHDV